MALDPNAERRREVVSYVRVGRGMVKITKYENEQPKSPSDTTSIKSRSSSDHSALTPGPSTRGWLRRPRGKGSNKRTPSARQHRSRSRSSARSFHTIARSGGYMRSDHDVSSSEYRPGDVTPSAGRREIFAPQGLFAPNSRPVPGSPQPGESFYDKESNYPKSTPCSSIERVRGRGLHISPPLSTSPGQPVSHPSPSTLSWTTESEIDPATNAEMWSHITRLEDELVSRFGRGAVPQFSSLRSEKSSAPPTTATGDKRDPEPALPDELIAALQREPPATLRPSEKLKQRSFEPLHLAEPPRRVHRAKSSPTLVFPLPPPTIPDWVTNTPLPSPPARVPQGFAPSLVMMRAKAGPPPPFAPPPDFPPPPIPRSTRSKAPDAEDSDAIAALYHVLLERAANSRPEIGKAVSHGTLQPEETGKNRRNLGLKELRPGEAGRTGPTGTPGSLLDENKGSRTPSASITMV